MAKHRTPKHGPGWALKVFAFGALLSGGYYALGNDQVMLLAADAMAGATPAPSTGDVAASVPIASDTGAAVPATSSTDAAGTSQPAPTPAMPAEDQELNPPLPVNPGETPQPEESPEPEEPSTPTDQAANGVPLYATYPVFQQPFSAFDLANVESPAFLSAAINDFAERPLAQGGNWDVKPHLSISSYYDGNVFLRNQDEQSDFVARVAPGLTLRLGNADSMFYLMADYTLGLNYYVEHPSESTADQDGRAQFQWSLPKTTIGFNVDAKSDTGPDIDVSDRVREDLYYAGLTAHYTYSEKTAFDVGANYTRSEFNGLITSSQWQGDFFFDYQYSPKTQFGLGGDVGTTIVPGQASQDFEDATLRMIYQATGKLTFVGELGGQFRQFDSGIGSTFTPVFTLEGAWNVREGTQLSVDATRAIYASAILNAQNYTATSFDITVTQRVTDYVSVGLAGGYVNTSYSAAAADVDAVREDNYFYIRPSIDWKALSWLSIGIYYQYSRDISEGGVANSFRRDTGGVDLAIIF